MIMNVNEKELGSLQSTIEIYLKPFLFNIQMMYIHDSTQIYIVFEGWQPTNNSRNWNLQNYNMISYHFGDFISFCYAIKEFIGSCFALLFIASFSNLLVALRQGLTSRLLWSDPNQAEVKYATTDSRFDRSGASEPSEANWFTNYLRWVMFVCI